MDSLEKQNNIIRISVRNLVEFLLRSGSLDTREGLSSETAMLEGARIHRMLQKKAGEGYRAEVLLRLDVPAGPAGDGTDAPGEDGQAILRLEGRADGIFFMKDTEAEPGDSVIAGDSPRADTEAEAGDLVIPEDSPRTDTDGKPGNWDSVRDGLWVIDEIKTVSRGLGILEEPKEVHLAQARCYAYMYACREGLDRMKIRMTYCSRLTDEVRFFYEEMSFSELEKWFTELIRAYTPWVRLRLSYEERTRSTIRRMTFPFPYREGQYDLAAGVYRTIVHEKKLFLQAPTGTGKTMAVLFPSLKAVGEGKADRIFYLTAKGVTGAVAQEALSLLQEKGLSIRSLSLISKERACPFEEADCVPETCPRANGHFDRVNDALRELLQGAASGKPMTAQTVAACAEKHNACPYYLSLDAADFADVIICDYNYVFHPQARLTRFFGDPVYTENAEYRKSIFKEAVSEEAISGKAVSEDAASEKNASEKTESGKTESGKTESGKNGAGKEKSGKTGNQGNGGTIILVDEAHNLLERGRDLYSARISGPEIRKFRKSIKTVRPRLWKKMKGLVQVLRQLEKEAAEDDGKIHVFDDWTSVRDKKKTDGLSAEEGLPVLRAELSREVEEVRDQIQWILEQENRSAALYGAPDAGQAGLTELLEFYFGLSHFGQMLQELDGHYIVYAEKEGRSSSGCLLHLYCADPSGHLRACMGGLKAAILFSATFLPIQYYKGLLGGRAEDFEMYARSSFSSAQRKVVIVRDVTSRYRDRNEENYARIARSIEQIVTCRPGNYMVYFPSYAFLENVLEAFCAFCHPTMIEDSESAGSGSGSGMIIPGTSGSSSDIYVLAQKREMGDSGRRAFLEAFEEVRDDRHLIGFCVLGGMFGEGIDLRSDRLIGSLIVGTGIPPVEPQRELLREFFSGQGRNGYDFAYRFPGMNKVLQAAGRVIRTAEDVGIVVLMDGRFSEKANRELFPPEWEQPESVASDGAAGKIRRFWEENHSVES